MIFVCLQNIAENIYTVQDVLDEITNRRQLRNLVVLPYNVTVKDVFGENTKQGKQNFAYV